MANPSEIPTPIGSAPAFLDMLAHISQAAPLNRPVLVIGERGTGKELVAGRLALLSPRWSAPFIKLNCAALPDTLLDAELFGHEAGAFTGAQRRRPGRFEMADRGTLFLDEIATASPAVQEKLLRVIEYGSFERVGGGETLHVDVRIVAATNMDLPSMAAAGKFRADLLDRLAFDVVTVPPLRSRPDDIMRLAQYFAERMTSELGRDFFAGFSETAAQTLRGHDWPGNVRELRNTVERSVYRLKNPEGMVETIVLDPFTSPHRPATAEPPKPVSAASPAPTPAQITTAAPVEGELTDFAAASRAFEAQLLNQALTACRFNQAEAARRLGLSYYQFRHHLRVHGMLTGNIEKSVMETADLAASKGNKRRRAALEGASPMV